MAELREVFEIATTQIDPDLDAWEEQERRQRRVARNRRIGGFAAAAVFALIVVVVAVVLANTKASTPTHVPPSTVVPPPSSMGVVIGLDGTVQRYVPGSAVDAQSLALSPDGRTIAFVEAQVHLEGGQPAGFQIGTIGIDGTNRRFITEPGYDPSTPAWSPDGSRIAFVSGGQIFTMHADGSGLTKLTNDAGEDRWPTWSPDGSTIAYSNRGSGVPDASGFFATQEIWTVPASGGTPSRITHNNVADDAPSYSPDGSRIAFFHDYRIWIMGANGAHAHPLAGVPHVAAFNPRWSPDGSRIAFLSFHSRSATVAVLLNILVADLSTGTFASVPGKVQDKLNAPSWLPSGAALLMNRYSP